MCALLHSWCVHNVSIHEYIHIMFVSHMLEPQEYVHCDAILCKKSQVMFGTNFHTGV